MDMTPRKTMCACTPKHRRCIYNLHVVRSHAADVAIPGQVGGVGLNNAIEPEINSYCHGAAQGTELLIFTTAEPGLFNDSLSGGDHTLYGLLYSRCKRCRTCQLDTRCDFMVHRFYLPQPFTWRIVVFETEDFTIARGTCREQAFMTYVNTL